MSKFRLIIGIDISKNTFDATRLFTSQAHVNEHQVFEQNKAGFNGFVKWVNQSHVTPQEVLICMEHTGLYIHGLLEYLKKHDFVVWVEMPLRIKRSIGLQRGGDDKLSSRLIAQYAYRYQDACKPWVAEDELMLRLRQLTAQRERMVRQIKALEVPVNELHECGQNTLAKELEKIQSKAVKELKAAIEVIEQRINPDYAIENESLDTWVNSDTTLHGQHIMD